MFVSITTSITYLIKFNELSMSSKYTYNIKEFLRVLFLNSELEWKSSVHK